MSVTRRGKAWRINVYAGTTPDGQEIRLTETVHGTKQQAKDREGELRKKARERVGKGAASTVDVLLDRWLEVARLEPSTKTRTDSYLKLHIRPQLGKRPVAKLSTAELDRHYVTLEEHLAPATVRRVHGVLRAALEQAVTWGWIDRNPAARCRLPEVPDVAPDVPDVETVKALLADAKEKDRPLFVFMRLAAVTSMRKGEVCALRRDDVNLTEGWVRRAAAVGEAKGGAYLKATKTGVRDKLAIDPETVGIVAQHLAEQTAGLLAAGFPAPEGEAFLFSNRPDLSVPWRPDHVSKRFAEIRGTRKVEIRQLRHFGATEMMRAGFAPRTVAARLGHSRPSTTMNRYGGEAAPDDVLAAEHVARLL